MRLLERSWLYISRKKGKTLVMFCILFVMATGIISGISIKNAAKATMQQARERVGGNFSLNINYDESNPNIKREEAPVEDNPQDGMSFSSIKLINEGPPLTQQVADQIKQVEGIKYSNGSATLSLDNHGLKHIEPKMQENQLAMSSGDFPNIQLNINTDAQYDALFQEQKMKLVEGRFPNAQDKHKVMIHKSLAEKNNLHLHDELNLLLAQHVRDEKGLGEEDVTVEIIGIFDTVASSNDAFISFLLPENTILADAETGASLTKSKLFEFDHLTFGVHDPKDLSSIVETVKKLDLDWNQFAIDTHDQEYQMMAGRIENLDGIMTGILYAIFIVSCIIVSLILSLWIKGRIHETGILLSIGIHKWNIITQYALELLMIAVIAFGLSYCSGKAISQTMSDLLIKQMIAQEESRSMMVSSVSVASINGTIESIKELNVSVDGSDLMYVYVSGGLLIILSVLISSISIVRLKPKEILAKMS